MISLFKYTSTTLIMHKVHSVTNCYNVTVEKTCTNDKRGPFMLITFFIEDLFYMHSKLKLSASLIKYMQAC
jgi:hypothetical protein